MNFRNTNYSYGLIAIGFHWISAVIALTLLALGVWMRTLSYYDPWYHIAPDIHKSLGITLAVLVTLRLLWKMINASPEALGHRWERIGAKVAHSALYMLLFALFFTGYLLSTGSGNAINYFGLFDIVSAWNISKINSAVELTGVAHKYIAYTLAVLTFAHAAAAIKHHFVNRDKTLLRMIKPN